MNDKAAELVRSRYYLLIKGWMTASDIAEFVPCSRDTSYKIFKAIRAQNKHEGIENLTNVVLTKRVMDYLKIDESQIRKEMKEIETNEGRRH
jgi:hypothetical protein